MSLVVGASSIRFAMRRKTGSQGESFELIHDWTLMHIQWTQKKFPIPHNRQCNKLCKWKCRSTNSNCFAKRLNPILLIFIFATENRFVQRASDENIGNRCFAENRSGQSGYWVVHIGIVYRILETQVAGSPRFLWRGLRISSTTRLPCKYSPTPSIPSYWHAKFTLSLHRLTGEIPFEYMYSLGTAIIDEKSKHTLWVLMWRERLRGLNLHLFGLKENATASACKYGCYWRSTVTTGRRSHRVHFMA